MSRSTNGYISVGVSGTIGMCRRMIEVCLVSLWKGFQCLGLLKLNAFCPCLERGLCEEEGTCSCFSCVMVVRVASPCYNYLLIIL